MLTYLELYSEQISILNVVQYITFRTGAATMTAMLFVFLFGPGIIRLLKFRQGHGQPIRADGPEEHFKKAGTPTMGGLIILLAVLISSLLWARLTNTYVWCVLGIATAYGAIGFYDDYLKVKQASHKGFSGRARLGLEAIVGATAVYFIGREAGPELGTSLALPFFKNLLFDLSVFYFVFGAFVIVGAANSVNLTDGLDGLAIVPVMIAAASFGLIAYVSGRVDFADYLQIQLVRGTGELSVVCGALIGAGLGFLWYNAPPAAIFMGDTGSLSLGGMLGTVAVASKHEFVLAIIGGIFVVEALSVIIQVASYKLTGKRVFRMAPIHHHFEKLGWTEPQVVIRFWIIAVVLALIGLSTLKLR
ncbi:MAG TPA: phospho-N-acetylmuramoyl-pentapeptide-transferase [Afifellaceae bacterium]|nr:phospho-N-acetylmuramoyl-pentapeptide-transferase [Afifellaceae bacterium]